MRKTLCGLTLAVLMASGQAFADLATLDALKATPVPLTAEQAQVIAAANGDALVEVVTGLVAANSALAPDIVVAAACAAPDQASAIIEQGIAAAPAQAEAINASIALGCPLKAGEDLTAPSTGVPTGGGGPAASSN
jgi:hypothetical protein